MDLDVNSWSDAWAQAAYGRGGFWRRSRPGDHFATAAGAGPELALTLACLLTSFPAIHAVVDVGAGAGSLLSALAARDHGLDLVGVDLRPRPPGLAAGVRWVEDCWDVHREAWMTGEVDELMSGLRTPVLLVATEWLDDLPCRVAASSPARHRELRSDGSPGAPLAAEDQAWVDRWWPTGARVEVGRARDVAWASLVAALEPVGGLALAVDYGHERSSRPATGSLAGFRAGRPAPAHPDRCANLTAAVAVDALAEAGERAGAHTLWRRQQHDVLADLLPAAAVGDPLEALAARSRRAALLDRRDWGNHWWLLQHVSPAGRMTA